MIRDLTINDINDINKIVKDFDNNFAKHYNLSKYIDNEIYIVKVYEEDSLVKGFIIANHLYENIEILLVFVDKSYRNKGIATKLINELSNYDGVEQILLEVAVNNDNAIKLYNSLGFEEYNRRKKYYDGIDAILMKKRT